MVEANFGRLLSDRLRFSRTKIRLSTTIDIRSFDRHSAMIYLGNVYYGPKVFTGLNEQNIPVCCPQYPERLPSFHEFVREIMLRKAFSMLRTAGSSGRWVENIFGQGLPLLGPCASSKISVMACNFFNVERAGRGYGFGVQEYIGILPS